MLKINLLILLFFTPAIIFAQNDTGKVKFVVRAPGLSDSSSVYITGSDPKLGSWNPSAVPLRKINDSTWTRSFIFKRGGSIQYKITLGSWAKEAVNDDGSVPGNSDLSIDKDTILYLAVHHWKNEFPAEKPTGQITGTVEYLRNLKGQGIKNRDAVIWLPPSYFKNKTKRYPVLYMQDGENLFDPKTSSFGTDWQLDEAADSLIKNGTIKDLIIIGIYNTSDRSMEYRDTPEGKSYMNFVVHWVKPLIDKKYRTLPGRENTAVGGSSLGGLISFMLAWKYPGVFSGAACLSPAFDIEDINYIPAVINYSGKKKAVKFYIDCGTAGLDAKLLPGSEEMIRELENKGYKSGKDILFYKAEGAKHNEAAWSKRNPRYLEFLFGRSK